MKPIYELNIDGEIVRMKIIDSNHVSLNYTRCMHPTKFKKYHKGQFDPDETLGREVLSVINEYKKGESK